MQSAKLKIRRIIEVNFTLLAIVEETCSLGRGREKHGWNIASEQCVPRGVGYFWFHVLRLTLMKYTDLY